MIHILFTPGSFGSALEWGIRTYSHQYEPLLNAIINPDGSWHSFKKMFHCTRKHELLKLEQIADPQTITTILFPVLDWSSEQIFDYIRKTCSNDKTIMVTVPDMQTAELILLMRQDKIANGIGRKSFGEYITNVTRWNENYTSVVDMKPWEYREWFSGMCSAVMQETVEASLLGDPSWLKIPATDILNNFSNTIKKIISFAELDYRHIDTPLVDEWLDKQQKNVNLQKLINDIVIHTIDNNNFTWKPISIVAEALVQKKLQDRGYSIRCYGLDRFPTDSLTLHALLEYEPTTT